MNKNKKKFPLPLILYFFIIGAVLIAGNLYSLFPLLSNYSLHLVIYLILFSILIVFFVLLIFNILLPIIKIDNIINSVINDRINFNIKNQKHFLIRKVLDMLSILKESSDREHAAELVKKQAEFSELQSQINPHFLYNTLESIRSEAIEKNVPEIARMTRALSNFFRYSISKSRNLVSLADELKNCESYFEIQQYRFDNKFSLFIDLEGENENTLEYKLPKLTLQPIIENSIFHGLEKKIGQGKVTIKVTTIRKRLLIRITDDGIGIEKQRLDELKSVLGNSTINLNHLSKNEKGTGIALIIVNHRIRLYFGNEYGISIQSMPNVGTDVEILLPLITDSNFSLKESDLKYEA